MELDRNSIARKLRALRERTIENGCTEQEAYAAAAIALKLTEKYNLTMTDIEIGDETCLIGFIETGRKRHHEVQYALGGIKKFTNCICYLDNAPTGGKIIVFFGLPQDVELAKYLTKVVKASMDNELALYKARCKVVGDPTGRQQSHSFLLGMADRVRGRLYQMRADQTKETLQKTGRDLVVVKDAVVLKQWDDSGITLQNRGGSTVNNDHDAYSSGKAAGSRVNLNRPIGGSSGGHLLGSK
jgi:hypothetical protein